MLIVNWLPITYDLTNYLATKILDKSSLLRTQHPSTQTMDNSIYNVHVQFPMNVDPHVQFNMGDMTQELRVRVPDILLGVVLALCTLVGVPGNIVALRYFTTARKTVLPTYLYIAIASVDICTGR